MTRIVPFANPQSHLPLVLRGNAWVDAGDGNVVARVVGGVPRFNDAGEQYADSFGWQWHKWDRLHRLSQNPRFNLHDLLRKRTHFDELDTRGKTILECGCGAGGDTEYLLTYPFAELHAIDLSRSVEVVARDLNDPRLVTAQASILEMPYPDESFDFVYCHRVIQHTPDPESTLRAVCRKVKPGGILFAHSYRRTLLNQLTWKYRYRWLARRLSPELIYRFVDKYGARLHRGCDVVAQWRVGYVLVKALAPFNYLPPELRPPEMSEQEVIELEKLITFDALTPTYDQPMRSDRFSAVIESEGFRMLHFHASRVSVVYATAIRNKA